MSIRNLALRMALGVVVAGCAAPTAPAASLDVPPYEAGRVDELGSSGYFWDVPDPLPPGTRGDLIKVYLRDSGAGARVYRSMYLSTSVDGLTPVAVTGTIWVPESPAPPNGFPIVAWGPGFSGMGDDCALSRHPENDYLGTLAAFVADGFVVASTDFEGHGTTYPYLLGAGESSTHSLLDGARAAQDLLGPAASDTVVIAGHSFGGIAASETLLMAPSYAEGLDIRGVVAIEGVGDLERAAAGVATADDVGVFELLRIVRGYVSAYPELRAEDILTPYGIELLNTINEDGCQPFPALDDVPYLEVSTVDLMQVEPWARRFRSQTVREAPYPVVYVMAENGAVENVRAVADRLCQTADQVGFKVYPGTDHDSVIDAAYSDYSAWMVDRVAGDEPFDGCDF